MFLSGSRFRLWLAGAVLLLGVLANGRQPLKIIGAGLGRTGGTSLREALAILGYKAYAAGDNFDGTHGDIWLEAMRMDSAKKPLEMFAGLGYNATLDDPSNFFVSHFLKRYPKAKVILTTRRSTDEWWQSAQLLIDMLRVQSMWPISWEKTYRIFGRCMEYYWREVRTCIDINFAAKAENCKTFYEAHNARIRTTVPAEQLLEYSVEQGWGPLCRFLAVPEPSMPFPIINSGNDVRRWTEALSKHIWKKRCMMGLIGLCLLVCLSQAISWLRPPRAGNVVPSKSASVKRD